MAKRIARRELFGAVSAPLYAGLLPSMGCQGSSHDTADRQQQPSPHPYGRCLATECCPIVETYKRDGQSRLCTLCEVFGIRRTTKRASLDSLTQDHALQWTLHALLNGATKNLTHFAH